MTNPKRPLDGGQMGSGDPSEAESQGVEFKVKFPTWSRLNITDSGKEYEGVSDDLICGVRNM